MQLKLIFPLLAVFLLASGTKAASTPKETGYNLNPTRDIILTATALTASGLGIYLYNQTEIPDSKFNTKHLLPWDRPFAGRYSKAADRMSDAGALFAVAPFAIGGAALYSGNSSLAEFGTFSLMFAQAILFQNGINLATRSLQVWPRPYVYSESKKGKKAAQEAKAEAYGSFFSGHASAAFTVAVFTSEWFNETHPNSPYLGIVRALAFSLAGFEGALRVAAGKHYPSDIFVGALVGTGVSYGILQIHKKRNEKYSLWVGPGVAGVTIPF